MATTKVYSIGRETGCNIVINDSTDVISRRHAILSVSSNGKMTITDQSHNGTYVNGIRISPNVPVPVTRQDNVSFAHVAQLDWNQVPGTSGSSAGKIILFSVLGVLLAGAIVAAILLFTGKDSSGMDLGDNPDVVVVDTVPANNNDTVDVSIPDNKVEESNTEENADSEKTCPVCGKKMSECLYDGKHPRCKDCGKATDGTAKNRCQYNGNHPRCEDCGKVIDGPAKKSCQYKGKHPKCQYKDCGKVVGASKNACPYNGDVKKHEAEKPNRRH